MPPRNAIRFGDEPNPEARLFRREARAHSRLSGAAGARRRRTAAAGDADSAKRAAASILWA